MLDRFMTEQLTLTKKDSRRIEGIKANVQDKIYIKDVSISVEEDDIFEHTNLAGAPHYLKVTKVIYYNHPSMGHIEINYQKIERFYRIYLDTNIVSRINDFRLKEEDARALRAMSEKIDKKEIELFTSIKAKEELEKIQQTIQRDFLLFIYNLVKKVPVSNLVVSTPSTFGSISFGTSRFGGGRSTENPLLIKLKTIFDKDDAEHIFQAERSNMDFFLTLDKKSIIDRINDSPDDFRKIGLKINIVLPVDLSNILEIKNVEN